VSITKRPTLHIFTDGASRGNPGPSGIGVYGYLDTSDKSFFNVSAFLGKTTNNVAEYSAFALALHLIKKHGTHHFASPIKAYADSELLVKQVKGTYSVRNPKLRAWHNCIKHLLDNVPCELVHIPREHNRTADVLANTGIDKRVALPDSFVSLLKQHHLSFLKGPYAVAR